MGEFEKGFQDWVCKQPLETAAVAATRALQGAAEGLFYETLARSELARQLFPFEIFGTTALLKARGLAVLRGTNGAMVCALKRIRGGKDDTEARAFAGFTSGFMFQTFTHSPPCCGPDAIAVGLFFAACQVVGMSHLVTAGIPLGPRIKILNHIERDPDLLKDAGKLKIVGG